MVEIMRMRITSVILTFFQSLKHCPRSHLHHQRIACNAIELPSCYRVYFVRIVRFHFDDIFRSSLCADLVTLEENKGWRIFKYFYWWPKSWITWLELIKIAPGIENFVRITWFFGLEEFELSEFFYKGLTGKFEGTCKFAWITWVRTQGVQL